MSQDMTADEAKDRAIELLEQVADRAAVLAEVAATLPARTEALEDIGEHLVGVKEGMESLAQAIVEMPTYVELQERLDKAIGESETRQNRARHRTVAAGLSAVALLLSILIGLGVANRVTVNNVDHNTRCAIESTINQLIDPGNEIDLARNCPSEPIGEPGL